jgi:predicted AlkP superfamily pyrophosphatase or phosphodiesterase
MLPSPPKSLGMLGDVLTSALGSVLGKANLLSLSPKKSVCLILIDGLGLHNLKQAGAHASFLNSQQNLPASCYFPSTTASSLVSLATGKPPWQTGFIGYQVYDRETASGMNLLSGWASQEQARRFQKLETISEMAVTEQVQFNVIAHSSYKHSGFSAATMRGATFHGIDSISDRFAKARQLLAQGSKTLTYLYVPELDQTAHALGYKSNQWLELLEDVDSEVSNLARGLSKSSGIVLTADHGVVDIEKHNHIYVDEIVKSEELEFVGGDTRGLFLYLKEQTSVNQLLKKLNDSFADLCYILTPEELVAAGYWQQGARDLLLPEIILLAKKEVALYHRAFAKKKSLEMIGHHGSITSAEMTIPLIRIGF